MKPAARPPAPDLGRDAYERVKAAIREGTLPPGTRLTEAELVARLGISRTPIRQALTRLETEGLVSHEPRRGVVVSRPDHQQVIELYSIREVLEGTAARFAAQHASEAELEALTQLVAGEGRVLDRPAELSAINLRLHALLHRAAHNRYLLRALAQLTDNMALLPTMLGDPPAPGSRTRSTGRCSRPSSGATERPRRQRWRRICAPPSATASPGCSASSTGARGAEPRRPAPQPKP